MGKRFLILILAILFIGVGLGIFLAVIHSNNSDAGTSIKQQIQKEAPPEEKEHIDDDNEITKEKDTVTDQVKNFIVDTVQNTIDFFANKEINIVAVGDSLTQGVGDPTGNGGYVGILDQMINGDKQIVTIESHGKRGNRSDQLLKRLNKEEIESSISAADIVLITVGANDIMQVVKENFTNLTFDNFQMERVLYEDRLEDIFQKASNLNEESEIYLIGFYNPFEKYFPEVKELGIIVDNWNNTSQMVADSFENVTFIPTIDLFTDQTVNLFAEDNFHPNYQGYQRIAERVLEYLTREESEQDDGTTEAS